MNSLWVALLLLAITQLAISSTSPRTKLLRDPDICGTPVCKGITKFGFQPLKKYVYRYSISTKTMFDGAGSNSSNLYITADVAIKFKTSCEGVLQISKPTLTFGTNEYNTTDPGKNKMFAAGLTEYNLRFSFDGGLIKEICPNTDEPIWALNIKKALLSSIQNTMDRFDVDQTAHERDINGDCLVGYFFKEVDGTTLIIDKKTDLKSCVDRYQMYSIVPMSPYVFQKKYHKWTPLNSSLNCIQLVDNKVYKGIQCVEEHAFQPFHNKTNGAKTYSTSNLELTAETPLNLIELEEMKLGAVQKRDNLLFDHRRPKKVTHDNLLDLKNLIVSLCQLHEEKFSPKYPDIVNRFIHIARDLSVDALSSLYNISSSLCLTGRKHMLDALPYIRSRASTKVMVEVMLNKEVSDDTAEEWLIVMSFFPRPDYETVDAVSKLLLQEKISQQAMLSITSIYHGYCAGHENCENQAPIRAAVEKMEIMFNASCSSAAATTMSNQGSIVALKSIGNAGVLTPSLESSLLKCVSNENLSTEIRLEAISAHRRLPCETNQNKLLRIFSNQSEHEEIRIAAYLQVMKCPSYPTLKAVKHALFIEEFNQVGSFVWSHLNTLMKSSQPSRVEIQAMLQDEEISNKFDKDPRKFSKNYETSIFFNEFGIGGAVEANVIFTRASYIPRNVMVNFTINMFGESLNVLELNFRLQGLEKYAEKLFYGDALFSRESLLHVMKYLRVVRSQPSSWEYLLNSIPFKKIMDSIKISCTLKMFGNELRYHTIDGHAEFIEFLEKLNPMKIIRQFLSGNEIKFDRSAMLIDASYITPMSTGIPLKLNTIGTATFNIDAMGLINTTEFSKKLKLDLEGKLNPSIGVNVEGVMEVDAFFTTSGVKFKGSIFTSTALDGSMKWENYKNLKLTFHLPMIKSDIFHAETQLLLVTNDDEENLTGVTAGRTEKSLCSWAFVDETIGLKLCASTLLPNSTFLLESPMFLFSGPLKFEFFLEKSDPTAKIYIIEYRLDTFANNKSVITLKLETPGSTTRRGLSAVIDLDTQSQNLTLVYQSTLSHVMAQGYYKNTPSEKMANFGLDINGKKHIDIRLGFEIKEGKYGKTYYPKTMFAINGKRIVSLSGSIKTVAKKGIFQCDIDLNFQTQKFSTYMVGYIRLSDASFATNIKMDYKFNEGKLQTVRIELKIGNKSTKSLTFYSGELQLESTAYPDINMVTSMNFTKAQSHVDWVVDMYTNPFIEDDTKKLRVTLVYQQYEAFSLNKLNTSLAIRKPNSDIDIKIGFSKHQTPVNTNLMLLIRYATKKEIVTSFDVHIPLGSLFYFESRLVVMLHGAKHHLTLFSKIFEKKSRDYDIELLGQWFSGHNITVKGMYQDKSSVAYSANPTVSHGLKLLARSQLFNDVLFIGRVVSQDYEYNAAVNVEHNEITYGITFKYSQPYLGIYESFGEVLYNKTVYSINNFIDVAKRKVNVELHFDRFRDVHITLHATANKSLLDAALDFKWDANRDPSQKLAVVLNSKSYDRINHDGSCTIEYPGKVITAVYFLQHKFTDYVFSLKVDWSPKDIFSAYFHVIYDLPDNGIAEFRGKVDTPFKNWEQVALGYRMQLENQRLTSNGSLIWQKKQKADVEVSYYYKLEPDDTNIYFISMLNSSIPGVNSMKGIIRHQQKKREFSSEVIIQTNANNTISFGASGARKRTPISAHYNGSLYITTSFEMVKRASAVGELNIYPEKFEGKIRLMGNGKKYTTSVKGYMKVITESQLMFQIETPFEKYKAITGKMLFSATNKTFFADLKSCESCISPANLGAEVIYIYNNFSHFNLKIGVHSSISFVKKLLIVGKRDPTTIDARFVWNNLVLGLIGRYHYFSLKDLDYAIQLFTPIEGYNKASLIAKVMLIGKIDLEASLNVAEKKVGLIVQSMYYPDENFAVPDFDADPPRKNRNSQNSSEERTFLPVPPVTNEDLYFGSVYLRGFFQLDTPMYPTVFGLIRVLEDDGNEYDTLAYFKFPFGQLRLNDELNFNDFLNLENKLSVVTSCPCLETFDCTFGVSGTLGFQLATDLIAQAKVNSIVYEVVSKGSYDFKPISEDSGKEGYYHMTTLIRSPIKMLNFSYTDVHIFVENPLYLGNATFVINNSSLKLDGSMETYDSYFDANIGLKINSSLLILPDCRINLFKDFTDFEKKVEVGISLPNEKGNALVKYGVVGLWHYDPPNFLKTDLEIITPYSSIGVIKGSVAYTYNSKNVHYFLETFLRYGNHSEIRASCNILTDIVSFNIDSSFDTLRKININGTLKNSAGVRSFQVVMSSDKRFRLMGWATVIPNRPLMAEVKLYKVSTNEELFNVILNAFRKENGYNVHAIIMKSGQSIHILCDYLPLQMMGRKIDITISTNNPKFESLKVNAVLLNEGYSLMVYRVKGTIKSAWITTNVTVNGDLSFHENGGVSHNSIQSPQLSVETTAMWMMEQFENVVFDLRGSGLYGDIRKELTAHVHFWNLNNEFDRISFSGDLNYNKRDFAICANATLLWPAWNDLKFLSHVILPNKSDEIHTAMVHLFYQKDLRYGAHAIKYFRHPEQFDFLTMSEFSVQSKNTKGAFLVKTKQHRIYDKFRLDIVNNEYNVNNVLESTNLNEVLTIDMNYKRPKSKIIRMDIYYPHPTKVVEAKVDFTGLNNFLANLDCSTPFKAFPYIQVYVEAISTKELYVRLGNAKWMNNSAIFNYTHSSHFDNDIQLTDGSVLIDFPLTTRHTGLLEYTYESTDSKATGRSSLTYNNESLMSGNYTRSSEFTDRSSKNNIAIHVNNNFLPAGIIYNHRHMKKFPHQEVPYTDTKQLEFSKLTDEEQNYHFLGEYRVDQTEKNERVFVQGKYGEREIMLQKFTEGQTCFISSANVTLHSDVWFGSGINILHKANGKEVEFNVSYPRRNFIIVTDYFWNTSAIMTEVTVHPNKFKDAMSITTALKWYSVPDDVHNKIILMLGHPTFENNVTMTIDYAEYDNVLFSFDSQLEYSMDLHKKLTINGTVINKSQEPNVLYEFNILGLHPSSRLQITEFGYLQVKDRIFEIDTNMTYKRSYLPLMYWYTNFKVDVKQKFFQMERKSLRDISFVRAKYGKIGPRSYINSTLRSGKDIQISSYFYVDLDNAETELVMNFTPDASEKLLMKGWYKDHRHAILDVWRTYDDIEIFDANFFARLNHSRMLASSFTWRPDIRADISNFLQTLSNFIWNYAVETANFWTTYIKAETVDTLTDIWVDAKPIIQDFLDDMRNMEELKEDIEWIKEVFQRAYEDNEFYMQDIYEMYLSFAEEMSFKEKMAHVPKLFNELWQMMGETGETIRESILWLVQTVKKVYDKVVEIVQGLMTGETINKISNYLKKLTSQYDKLIKDMHISFIHYIEHLMAEASEVLHLYWVKVTTTIEPAFIQFAHYIESVVWETGKRVLEFIYEKQSELLRSAVFQRNANFTKDLDNFYQDITKNDFFTNVKKYAKMLYDIFTQKYLSSLPFGIELNQIGMEIVTEVTELYKLPMVNFTIEMTKEIYAQLKWTYNYLKVRDKFERLIPILYTTILDLTHTALDNEMICHESRTKFIFEPGMGQIILEQKLPVPWHSFNETPRFEEIPEYKILRRIHSLVTPSNTSFWSYYYKYAPFIHPETWLPPYDGYAIIVGAKYFRTFDGKVYDFSGQCSYLLATDFVGKKFTLFLRYSETHQYLISLLVHDHLVDIDLANNIITLQGSPTPLHLPAQIKDLYITASDGFISMKSKAGFDLECNLKYDVCTFSLSGWFFGKTAGLLGTLDNEPATDFLASDGRVPNDTNLFIDSWALMNCSSKSEQGYKEEHPGNLEMCTSLFQMKTSSFAACYPIINPSTYREICMKSYPNLLEDEICTSAQAYIKECGKNYIPLKIPSACIECTFNKELLEEGQLILLDKDDVKQSTDVVFIVEAKECNQYMREKKMVNTFITILTKELENVGLHSNRFAVVTYGGDGVFDPPQSVIVNNNIFTSDKQISKFFEKIQSGNGNTDIFNALRFAARLHYRPGVSKTFILIPCSDCDLSNMTVEYSALNHAFLEKNITLHVLMNADFDLEKLGVNKMFYGVDSERAYTKNDFKVLKGDSELRRQIKLTKSMMGYCTSLALGTNGTIFTGKRMGSENMALVKKFSSVFSRRIAATASPDPCQNCQCTTDENGIEFLECQPCSVPKLAYRDFEFKENGTLTFLQAFDQIGDIDLDN
ncbi:Domain of Unknown Function (DUF1081) [Nesidiocoris tenuis]|uniref:Vitellogenin domain-containing protein n=1 Tax=Nesidiocoris tenuis TaxID=355587 RepID=A0ABN7AEC9_9HEMI|nr:Domain of Unknown Function (DUF1081) [Nesidiocoris tenuis]